MCPYIEIFGRSYPSYGACMAAGAMVALFLCLVFTRRRYGFELVEYIFNLIWVFAGAMIGAKLLYLIVEIKEFIADPSLFLDFIGGGGVFYGGMLGGCVGAYISSRIRRWNFIELLDTLVGPICFAHCLGRVGCFMAGCCYGCETESALGIYFPEGGLAPSDVKLLPTQLFEAVFLLILGAIVLIFLYKGKTGSAAGIYLTFYPVWRFIIEFFRSDRRGEVGSLTTSQFISLFILTAGLALLIFRKKSVLMFSYPPKLDILVFGEVLWDVYEEEKILGGAPFNFAAHMVRHGSECRLISSVGDDKLGRSAVRRLDRLGVARYYVKTVELPTGTCTVTLKDGLPEYDLVCPAAYDGIPYPEGVIKKADAFCFGTLAQRGEKSRETLFALLEGGSYREVFLDINIRQHYYSREIIEKSLEYTTILKISREEIGVLSQVGLVSPGLDEIGICRALAKRFPGLKIIAVTLDKDGALAYETESGKVTKGPEPYGEVISTVGAGDSWSAGFLSEYLRGKPLADCLSRANRVASFVIGQLGAVPEYPKELK